MDPQAVWASGGAAPPAAGIDAEVVLVNEDSHGRELSRAAYEGDIPRSARSFRDRGSTAVPGWSSRSSAPTVGWRYTLGSEAKPGSLPKHGITVPPFVR